MMKFIFSTESETQAFAKRLATLCQPPLFIYFHGELGSGKTTLIRAILKNLGVKGSIKSPTFSLVESYEVDSLKFCHVDLYRLKSREELEYLGLRDYWDQNTICFIEWPEQAGDKLPIPDIDCYFTNSPLGREFTMTSHTERGTLVLAGLG
ncbi:MAG: tRNA (adenosine(37)-N6)-threonylcarbamoyltransferase complex ATPase subunit type 1 TsaE [Proteobacteria bacterium]|nr:tRNA (adenosine(37)-N6)-threonylcarbamoyltransferase complex ATPase subunit type 1 TsaE [Pseudomonadota bacterium]